MLRIINPRVRKRRYEPNLKRGTLTKLSKETGIPLSTLWMRVNKFHMTLEEAKRPVEHGGQQKHYVVYNEQRMTLKEACDDANLCYNSVIGRISRKKIDAQTSFAYHIAYKKKKAKKALLSPPRTKVLV